MIHGPCVNTCDVEQKMGQIQQVVGLALGVGKGCHNQTRVNCKGLFPKGRVL
jgi:hypothetical protein